MSVSSCSPRPCLTSPASFLCTASPGWTFVSTALSSFTRARSLLVSVWFPQDLFEWFCAESEVLPCIVTPLRAVRFARCDGDSMTADSSLARANNAAIPVSSGFVETKCERSKVALMLKVALRCVVWLRLAVRLVRLARCEDGWILARTAVSSFARASSASISVSSGRLRLTACV